MSYKFNGVDISTYGAVALADGEDVPLKGVFSLPKRAGETEYNWGTEIEAYVAREDIVPDGRKLLLSVALKGGDDADYAGKLAAFRQACVELRSLGTEFGDFDVLAKEEVGVEESPGRAAVFTIPLWQPRFTLPELVLAGSGGAGVLLDDFDLEKDFAIAVSELKDNHSIGKRIETNTTEPYLQTRYRDHTDITLGCFMKGASWEGLYARIMQFYAFCMSPGLRRLRLPDGLEYRGYFKDGVAVKADAGCVLTFDLKIRII